MTQPTNDQIHRGIEGVIQSLQDPQKLYETPVEPPRAENSFDTWEEAVEYYNLPRGLDYIYWDDDGPNDVWEQHRRIGKDAVLVLRERDEPHILNSSKGFPAAGVGWIDGPDGTRTPVVHDPNRWFEMSRGNVLGLGPRAVIEVGESDWTAPAQPYPMWYYDRNGVKKSELVGNQNKLLQTVSEVGIFANFTLKGRDLGDVCYSGVGFSGCRKSHLHDVRFVEASRGGEPIPNTETGAAVFYGGTNENQQFAYFISGVEIWNHESRSSSPLMFNRMSSGKVSDLTMHNAPAYGMPAYWRCWGLHIWQDSIVRSPKSGMNFEGCKNFDLVINWCTVNAGPGSFHFNIDPYGGSVNISALDLAYSTDGYVKDKVVYHAFHAHNPKMPVVQRDIDIAGDHPKALIPKERWLLTNQ